MATSTINNSDCNPQSLGTLNGFQYVNGGGTYTITNYSYRAVLPTPFAVAAGQKYWISIVGILDQDNVVWGWYSSGGASNGNSLQDLHDGNSPVSRQFNRAFTLEGVPSAFLVDDTALNNGVYYLSFPNGSYFGYYSYLADFHYLYHFDLGYEYVFDANDGKSGVYLYDFKSQDFFYTSPNFPFPYLYDLGLNAALYYYPDPNNPGRYNTNGTRYFYNFSAGQIFTQ